MLVCRAAKQQQQTQSTVSRSLIPVRRARSAAADDFASVDARFPYPSSADLLPTPFACPSRSVQPFPSDYNAAVRQAQSAVQAALADGATLIEVEFPTASLAAVAGDAEGASPGLAWPGACACMPLRCCVVASTASQVTELLHVQVPMR